jgi:hypothetical protein
VGLRLGYQGDLRLGYQGGLRSGYQGGLRLGYQAGLRLGYQVGLQVYLHWWAAWRGDMLVGHWESEGVAELRLAICSS